MNIRALAAQTLMPVILQRSSVTAPLNKNLGIAKPKDRPLLQELCFGVLRHYFELSCISEQLLSKALKPRDADISALVLLGLYQLKHMRTPDHAAISETVNAAKQLKKHWASKLLNGVLRNYLRQASELHESLENKPEYQTAHPLWLVKAFKKAWPDQWQDIVAANNQQGPLTLRVNHKNISSEAYLAQLEKQEITYQSCEHSPSGLTLTGSHEVPQLPGFQEGYFCVQDEAAQLSAKLLDLQTGMHVLDACCAPGGKTSHILEQDIDDLSVVAVELEAHRMTRVSENLARLKLNKSNCKLLVGDASKTDKWWDKTPFDRILLDAPCSATGVIRRHPDIKVLRRSSDMAQLSQLQAKLLRVLWPLLKPDGLLLYATCSVLPQENEQCVARFLEEVDDAVHIEIDATWGQTRPFGRQLLPQINGHDGFYYSLIRKKS
ncbi:MAG: 16S rRNA (cytosine(967)-C(5))-methyltransferase [Alteromonadaceae bacterium]|nr:MAG: 16S rRNA (cytosine(967)-C(5))-methyltransferase [Alteromonadaceae bacterium]